MKVHKGRYYVAVELAEAESIRAIMHIRENSPIISGSDCQLALRVGPTLLDESKGFVRSPVIQTAVARQCFRFIDSDHYFDADAFGYMLNALHFSPPELRALFYDEVRTCRRRMQKDWNLTTVSKVIKTPDEYHHFEFESLIAAARVAIRNAGLKLLDAYRLFDLNHDGLLNCSELYSGLLWAGMKEIKPDMVTSLVKHIDKTKDGRVRYRDFLIALNDPNELEEFVPQQVIKRPFAHFCYLKYCSSLQFLYLQQELDLTKIVIPLVEMAEIYSPPAEKSKQQVLIPLSITVSLYSISFYRLIFVSASTSCIIILQVEIEGHALKHIKVKVRPVDDWALVWDSRGTEAKNPVSIWSPVLSGSIFTRNKQAICTGHYAVAGLGSGNSKPPKAIKGAMLIELCDKETSRLQKSDVLDEQHVNFLMPHPVCQLASYARACCISVRFSSRQA
jgi:Ca2+-binding EF-hand superfamily protein